MISGNLMVDVAEFDNLCMQDLDGAPGILIFSDVAEKNEASNALEKLLSRDIVSILHRTARHAAPRTLERHAAPRHAAPRHATPRHATSHR